MKIVIANGKTYSEQSMRTGWFNAFKHLGHEAVLWDKTTPIFDVFDKFKSEAIMIGSNELNLGLVKCLEEFKPTKYLWLNQVKDLTEEQGKLLSDLDTTNCHNLTHSYIDLKDIDFSVKIKCILPAFDSIKFPQGENKKELECDTSYIGFADKEVRKALIDIAKRNTLRVYGYGSWNMVEYIGAIKSPKMFSDVVFSSNSSLILNEEICERYFKVLGCGGQCSCPMSDNVVNIFSSTCRTQYNNIWCEDSALFIKTHSYIQRVKELL